MTGRLVDELGRWVYPFEMGAGQKLFADGAVPAALKRTRSSVVRNGSLFPVYEPQGQPAYGIAGSG